MADKKFKTGVDLQSTVKISSQTAEKAMVLDASGNLVSSATSDVELGHLSGVTSAVQTQLTSAQDTADAAIPSSEKGANSGVATLDGSGKLTSGQVPAIAITSTYVVASEIAQLALTVQEGDVAVRSDLNQSFIALNADNVDMGDWQILLTPTDAVQSVNGETGTVVLDSDHLSDAGKTNKFVVAGDITKLGHISVTQAVDLDTMESDISSNNAKISADGLVTTHSDVTSAGSGIIISSTERTKLDGIEAAATADQSGAEIKAAYEAEASAFTDAQFTKLGAIEALADVTDATNVASAGATMDADTSLAGNGYFLDEDDMTSDDATKVPSQQSVKAYVDAQSAAGGNLSAGDIKETSFSGAADVATNEVITGLAFANGTVRSFKAQVSVVIDSTADLYEVFELQGIQKAAGWDMSVEATGDDSGISFDITSAGQIRYSKASVATWVSTSFKFRADTTSV